MSSKASLASLRHDPDELVAAAPQVHLVDDHVGAPIRRGRRDDQVQSVAALDPDIEPEPGGHLDAQLRQCRVRVAGECGIAPGKYREGLLELGGIEWAHGIPGHSASVHIVRHRVVVLNCDHATPRRPSATMFPKYRRPGGPVLSVEREPSGVLS